MHEFIVLCAIRKSGGEFVDVLTIMKVLAQRAQVQFPVSATYVLLKRMEKDGLVFMIFGKRQITELDMELVTKTTTVIAYYRNDAEPTMPPASETADIVRVRVSTRNGVSYEFHKNSPECWVLEDNKQG